MKRLKVDLQVTFIVIFISSFTLFLVISYTLIKNLIQNEKILQEVQTMELLMDINTLFVYLFLLFISFTLISSYFIYKLATKISSDAEAIQKYCIEISEDKNYEAIVHVDSYIEFLEISVLLKNIVKRLSQKEKKR